MKDMHWSYDHLPPHLRTYSKPICELAREYARTLPQSAELNAGLRKLMEAKDCFVRAAIETHGTKSVDRMHPMPARDYGTDPVSNQPLPADSPYSMAHVPVTKQEMKPGAARPFINSGAMVTLECQHGPESHRALCDFNMDRENVPCNCDRGTSLYLASAAPTYDTESKP